MSQKYRQIEDIVLDMREVDDLLSGIVSSLEGAYVDLAGSRALAKQVDDILERLMESSGTVSLAAMEHRLRLAPLLTSPSQLGPVTQSKGQRDSESMLRLHESLPECI